MRTGPLRGYLKSSLEENTICKLQFVFPFIETHIFLVASGRCYLLLKVLLNCMNNFDVA